MRISAKADYAVRAVVELAAGQDGTPVKAELVAGIPNRTSASLPPAIPGNSFDDCEPLSGHSLGVPVRWKSKADLSELSGRMIHLRLRMAQARLFTLTM